MKTTRIIWGLGIVFLLIRCGGAPSAEEQRSYDVMSDSLSNAFVSSSAAVENADDTTHKFIRTADLKFKVKSVINSTYRIEELTNRLGGFVTFTELASTIDHITNVTVSADSSLETTYYTVSNYITLRVPNTKLDTTLKEISKDIDYLDYRIIKANDVALQILSNDLTEKRAEKNEQRLINTIDSKGKKLNETMSAEEVLLNKQEQADDAKISKLYLMDQINFSTINITIYQRQTVKRELLSNDKNIEAFEPGFGSQTINALKLGWSILEAIIIFLIKLWGLILFGFLAYFLYKKFWHKIRNWTKKI